MITINSKISEKCYNEILEMINKEIEATAAQNSLPLRKKKVQSLIDSVKFAKDREEREHILRNLGKAQKRVKDAERKLENKEPLHKSYTFSSSLLK